MKEAINKIFEGNCIIFTGSGFSFGAENILAENRNIKSAFELAELLVAQCGINSGDNVDLRVAANYYRSQHSPASLVDLLHNEFTVSQISSDHEYIGTLK